jgi:CubicO group peptidase (beta-lactamase class C family)
LFSRKSVKMKSIIYFLIYCCFFATLFSCRTEQSTAPKVQGANRSISPVYQAPIFINDDRNEKVESIEAEMQKLMEEHAKSHHLPGVAYGIVVDNELVLASALGSIDVEGKVAATTKSSFRIASMTKSFTAMAIMKLRDEGKLSLSDPASKYIPAMAVLEYLTADAPVITIENLLTMTAGFPEDNPWGDRQLDEPDEMLSDLIKSGISFSNPPSYGFEYSNTGFALLGHIVSGVAGMPYQAYITRTILHPLGMTETYWEYDSIPKEQLALGYRWEDDQWKLEPMLHDGAYGAMGGLITSIEDFSKYVSFQLSAWPPRSDTDNGPVKRSSLREMQTPQFCRLNSNATDFQGNPCAAISGYGYGLGITEDCQRVRRVSHGGALPGFGSNYVFFPEYGVGIMAFCNLTYTSPYPIREIGKLLFDSLGLEPRKLPVSDILMERQKQIVELIKHWDPALEAKILAENFYLDQSRERRITEIQEVLDRAGAIKSTSELEPGNQLRGNFKLEAEHGTIDIFFTLTPERIPLVQQLDVSFRVQ